MNWKRKVNVTLEGIIGYNLTRARKPGTAPRSVATPPPAPKPVPKDAVRGPADPKADRLLSAPVFVMSPVRSGSTLLRVMLNSHSLLHAPIEMHVRRLTVNLTTEPVQQAMEALGHTKSDIEHILWDRMLHRELLRSGKKYVVDKTPSNVFAWKRISTCWPDARYIFLIRHPMSIAVSWHEADPENRPMDEAVRHTLNYMTYLEEARKALTGVTVRYEDLTTDPAAETARICAYLAIPPEDGMISYGRFDHGEFVKGIGDWREKIKTGTVQPGRPLPKPDEVPELLHEMCAAWGYFDQDPPADEAG